MDLSVIVCTCGRSRSLEKTLDSMNALDVPAELDGEIIVVDNDPSDATKSVVEQFAKGSPLKVVYVPETARGLSHARNRGIRESKGDFVVFTDDDVVVDRSWLREILRETLSDDGVGMIFGQTRRYSPDLPPVSVKENPSPESFLFPCSPWRVGHGNNMILKKDLIREVGLFDTWLGAGTKIAAAEDTDFVYRVLKSGRTVLYAPSIVVFHDHRRVTEKDLADIERNYAKGRGAFYCKHILRGDAWAARLLYRELRTLAEVYRDSKDKRGKVARNIGGLSNGILLRLSLETTRWIFRDPRPDANP